MRQYGKTMIIAALLVATLGLWAVADSSKNSDDAWLGVYSQTVDDNLAEGFDLDIDYGAIVNYVYDDSPADKAGLRDGDVIIEVNGRKMSGSDDLIDAIEDTGVDHELTLTIMRDGTKETLKAVLEPRPSKRERVVHINRKGHAPVVIDIPHFSRVYLGVRMIDLSRQLGEYFGVERGNGALITEVEQDSPADKAGMKAGDVMIRIGDERIFDRSDVRHVLEDKAAGDLVEVVVVRDGQEKSLSVELAEGEDWSNFGFDGARVVVPEIDIDIPDIPNFSGMHLGRNVRIFEDLEDKEEFQRELREAMRELREELKDVRKEIEVEIKELRELQEKQ